MFLYKSCPRFINKIGASVGKNTKFVLAIVFRFKIDKLKNKIYLRLRLDEKLLV